MPAACPSLRLSIELSTDIYASHTRERCPNVRFIQVTSEGARDLGTMRTDVEKPRLVLENGSVGEIHAQDIISRVIDEPAWLAELARVLAPGGALYMTLPAGGPLAWLDARNLYRYAVDIMGRGETPDDTLPTGWNRHYGESDAVAMLDDAGFADIEIKRVGIALAEPPQLAGLLIGNFLLGDRDAEIRLHPLRCIMERVDTRIPMPAVGTHFAITARRSHAEPDDPADEDAARNLPAKEIGSE